MRVIFMGTPDFAAAILDAVYGAGHEICAAVTQPDRPKGRGKALAMSDVKLRAAELGIPVLQPERVRGNREFADEVKRMDPDVIVVAAFGQILPKEILDIPRLGCINVHASLLPKYRGSAPIQQAVLNGDEYAGVTTMQMGVGLDTGDMLEKASIRLKPDETGGSLFDRLAVLGAELIVSTLKKAEAGTLTPEPQDDSLASYAGMLDKKQGEIDWTKPAEVIERLVRGMNPWPTAYTYRGGKMLKLWKTEVIPAGEEPGILKEALPGEAALSGKDSFAVRCGEGVLKVLEVQPEGKKRMASDAYLRGYPLTDGEVLGRTDRQ